MLDEIGAPFCDFSRKDRIELGRKVISTLGRKKRREKADFTRNGETFSALVYMSDEIPRIKLIAREYQQAQEALGLRPVAGATPHPVAPLALATGRVAECLGLRVLFL